jgi:hypothetical protein
VKLQNLLKEDVEECLVCRLGDTGDGVELVHGNEHGVGGSVDRSREAKDAVCDCEQKLLEVNTCREVTEKWAMVCTRLSSPQFSEVLDIVEPEREGLVFELKKDDIKNKVNVQ